MSTVRDRRRGSRRTLVSNRAGFYPVGQAALYRRWRTKEDLLLAALEHLAEPPSDEANPTDLRGCLVRMTEQVIDMFVGPKALVLPRVLIEASQYPPRFDDMVQNIVRARFGTVRTVIQAAVDRGELPARTPPDLIIDAIMGRVISLIVLTPGARRAIINAERDATPRRSPTSCYAPSRDWGVGKTVFAWPRYPPRLPRSQPPPFRVGRRGRPLPGRALLGPAAAATRRADAGPVGSAADARGADLGHLRAYSAGS
jgi:AcrR family transcriptional regulator